MRAFLIILTPEYEPGGQLPGFVNEKRMDVDELVAIAGWCMGFNMLDLWEMSGWLDEEGIEQYEQDCEQMDDALSEEEKDRIWNQIEDKLEEGAYDSPNQGQTWLPEEGQTWVYVLEEPLYLN